MVPNRATQSHIQSSLNWRTGKGNSKKIIMPKKHERHKTADPVDTRRRFNVYKTSIRRRRSRIDFL